MSGPTIGRVGPWTPEDNTMKRESGWIIEADEESDAEGGHPVTTLRLTATTHEEATGIISAALKSGATRITIIDEDRRIRDDRRSEQLSGHVEIVGEPGHRHVKPEMG